MFDFKSVISPSKLTKEYILSKVSDNQIFAFYFGNFRLGKKYSSKLRVDKDPSIGFFIGKSGELVYNDFRDNLNLNCFQYVQKIFGVSFKEALQIIATDFGLIEGERKVTPKFLEATAHFDRDEKPTCFIHYKPKPWDKRALDWWRAYEIGEEELKRRDIFNVDRAFINKKEIYNKENLLRFAYFQEYVNDEGLKVDGVKLYSPEDKSEFKWLSSIPIDIPFGLDKLPFASDTVWVIKSNKDLLECLKFFTDVIATQNEGEAAFPIQLEAWLLKRYKYINLCYGADPQGIEAAKTIVNRTNQIFMFHTPIDDYEKHKIEDPADYIRAYGLDAFKDLLQKNKLL